MSWNRRIAAPLVAVALLWTAAGFHRISDPAEIQVRSWPKWMARLTGMTGGGATLLRPGWSFCPPLLSRRSIFPADPVTIRWRWGAGPGGGALKSREGAGLLASGTMVVRADSSRLEPLVAAFPRGRGRAPLTSAATALIAEALARPIAEHAAATPFTALIQPGAAELQNMSRRAAEAGIALEPASALRFYPAPTAAAPAEGAPRPASGARRVLLIGLDGADWDIVDPLMQQGRMPNMKRLVDTGARARLKTITPVLSPIIWTSIATGVGPDKHGIMDFLATSKTTGNQIPVTSNMRRVKALWNILTDSGLSSGIIAWWATWPAEPVNGFIVSDRIAYQLFGYPDTGDSLRRRTYPEALALVIQPSVVAPSQIAPAEIARFLPERVTSGAGAAGAATDAGALTRKLETILASSRTYLGIGLDLLAAYNPDFKAIYFEGTDTIAHNFMRYRPPAMPGVTPAEVAAYGEVVDRFYEYQDAALGRLLTLTDDRTIVLVCSDHGFRTGSNRPATDPRIEMGGAADWHRKFGILVMNGPGVRKAAVLEDVSVMDITPTVLTIMGLPVAQDMTGRALVEAFDAPPAARTIASYETSGTRSVDAEPLGSAMDQEIVSKLTALGYVSQEGTNTLNNTGITLMERSHYSEAADVFRRALSQQPRFVQARLNLGRAQMLMKQYDDAIATLQEALKQDPTQTEVHNLLGNIYMERGDASRAEQAFRKSLEMRPGDTNAHNSLGLLYDKIGKEDLAIAEYRKVVAIDPDYAEGYNNIGLIHRKRGEPRKAIELFEQAIRTDPDFPGSYNNMGLAYQDLGDLKQARVSFERGLKVDPRNAVILNNLGTVDLAERDLKTAQERFEQAAQADPEYPSAYNNLGAVLGMMGKPEEAFEKYLKAVELDPNYSDARFNIARCFLEQHKTHEAIDMLDRLLKIDPRYGKGLLQLGIIYVQEGRAQDALAPASQAAREMPASADPHNLLADIYMTLGKPDEARRELEASLRINPSQPKVKEMLQRLETAPTSGKPQ